MSHNSGEVQYPAFMLRLVMESKTALDSQQGSSVRLVCLILFRHELESPATDCCLLSEIMLCLTKLCPIRL